MTSVLTHTPADCILLFGIPITLEDYDDHKQGVFRSDFLERCCPARMKFFNEVCVPVNEALPRIGKYGCHIQQRVLEADIQAAFSHRVVILFSHWADNQMEVRGKLLPDAALCELIPEDFSGIIDICACQPEDDLVVRIKTRASRATVKCTLMEITPAFWIEIIRISLYLLRKHKLHYMDATKIVLQEIFKVHNKTHQ